MAKRRRYLLEDIETHNEDLVLVVDDQPENLHYLRMLLKDYKIEGAASGRECLEKTKKLKPDLILLDIMMPGMDGFEVSRILKEDKSTSDIPIIFVTARVMLDDVIKGFELGANDYVTKPFEAAELIARVKTHLDLKKAKERVCEQFERVKKLNDDKNEFIQIASHDLRNPLKVIQGFTRLIKNNYDSLTDDNIKEFLDDISTATNGMLYIINDVLAMNDIDEGNYDLVVQEFDLTELSFVLQSEYRKCAETKKIEIEVIDILKNRTIQNDFLKSKQILENLISNAFNYSLPGTTVSIKIEAAGKEMEKEGYFARISISDEGPGISKEELPHIFDKFCKISNKPTGNEPSSGLGLAISKSLSDILGYKLECHTELGQGSEFSLYMPKRFEADS